MDNNKQVIEDLKKNFHDVLEAQKTRSEAEKNFEKNICDKIETQNKAADAMIEKMDAIEKKNEEIAKKSDDIETAVARIFNKDDENGDKYEMTKHMVKSYRSDLSKDFVYNRESAEIHKKAFDQWFRNGSTGVFNSGKNWTPEQLKFINTVIGPQGGFLVAPQYSTNVIGKAFNGRAAFELVDRLSIGSGIHVETLDEAEYADAENYNELGPGKPEDKKNEAFVRLTFNPQHIGYVKNISRTSLEDSFVNVSYHLNKMEEGLNRTIAQQILTGASQDRIRGILTYPDGTNPTGEVEQIESETSLAVTWDDLVKYLPENHKTDYEGIYVMNKKTWRSLLVSKDDNARYQMSEILAMIKMTSAPKPDDDSIMVNIKLDAGMPDYTTGGNLAVLYGDFKKGYLMVERLGMQLIRDETDIEDMIFKLRRRVGGQLRFGEAFKILKIQS
jgi:HK97 family phage major capsid protein